MELRQGPDGRQALRSRLTTPAVVSSPRTDPVPSAQTPSNSQGTSQDPQTISEDIFANIQNVQGGFVHRLIQNGALNFIQRTYKEGTLWTPRDCRIRRTSPNEEVVLQGIQQVPHPNSHSG